MPNLKNEIIYAKNDPGLKNIYFATFALILNILHDYYNRYTVFYYYYYYLSQNVSLIIHWAHAILYFLFYSR